VLFYGSDDHCYNLAARILNSPFCTLGQLGVELRVGFNAVGDKTRKLVAEKTAQYFPRCLLVDCPQNIYKYPMMRRLFYAAPVTQPFLLWFDDNSYLSPDLEAATWLSRVSRQLSNCAVLGSVYTGKLVGNQAAWIAEQPWYAGKEPKDYVKYVIDSWWAAQAPAITAHNWPPHDIRHHGGDIMLGEFCRQQDFLLCHFRDGVAINANLSGVEGAKNRRGFDAPPVGFFHPKPSY
jgi:hypothetical protein